MLTQERLKELLSYDQETGLFVRLKKASQMAIGSKAGCLDKSTGYVRINIEGKLYHAHRLAWLYMHGVWPDKVDHIDHQRDNNRINNLRDVTNAGNAQNKIKAQSNSKSGILGVFFNARDKNWIAKIKTNGVHIELGRFKTSEEASDAYIAAKRKLHSTCVI